MSDNVNDQKTDSKTAAEDPCDSGNHRCGRPHLSLAVSAVALLLAGYAIITDRPDSDLSPLDARLGSLESRVGENSSRLAGLNDDVRKNRDSLIQSRLKEVLLSIQEIKGMAEADTREAIAEAEKLLLALSPHEARNEAAEQPARTGDITHTPDQAVGSTPETEAAATAIPEDQPSTGAEAEQGDEAEETPAQGL